MQQMIVAETYVRDFERRVNKLIDEGWVVVPESLRATTSSNVAAFAVLLTRLLPPS